ncbi:MAG: sulfur carrier protein ThiS [Marinomonas colpomeniae]
MNIILNDVPYEFSGNTLKDLLSALEKEEQGIAIAIDQQVIPKSQWQSTQLIERSQVFIFESIAGG